MLEEVTSYLINNFDFDCKKNIYLDCTLGGGGHTKAILDANPNNFVIAIDRDIEAIKNFKKNLSNFIEKVTLVHNNFNNIDSILSDLSDLSVEKLDGALIDLGVSSYQLDSAERGFSYRFDSPLDMRMDQSESLTAYEIVNCYSESEIADIIFKYGEERFARRIARNIISERQKSPINTTFELVEIIKKSVPAFSKREKHPAKRTFQAFRIAVNDELTSLEPTVRTIFSKLKSGARMTVITFHSLEDRIVKNVFRNLSGKCTCNCRENLDIFSNYQNCNCEKDKTGILLNKKPITASEYEIIQNPRAKSAKLRVIEKI